MDGLDGVLHAGCSTGHHGVRPPSSLILAQNQKPLPPSPIVAAHWTFLVPVYPTCYTIIVMPTS
jgi:hypothetical protein